MLKIYKLSTIFILLSLIFTLDAFHTLAASLTSVSDILSRAKASQDSNHTITFTTPSGIGAGETVEITFAADFSTTSVDYTDIDIADDGTDLTLAATPDVATWGVAFGGENSRTLTITSGTGSIAAASVVTIEIGTNADYGVSGDQAINNPTSAGNYNITFGGTFNDSGITTVIILDDDQVLVSGQIDTALSFSIEDNAVGFGSFANTNVKYATADGTGAFEEQANDLPTKLTAGTNAVGGLAISIRSEGNGTNAGLYASSVTELIPAAASTEVEAASKKYGIYGKNASNLTISEAFDNDFTEDEAISRITQVFASSAGPVNGGSVDVSLLAAVNSTTKAGLYADVLTIVCTGNY